MKTQSKRWILGIAMVGVMALGQTAYAAQDPLMLPEQEGLQVISEIQAKITVESPNWEVKQVVNRFANYGQEHSNQLFELQTNQVISAGQLDVINALYYMNVRKNFYIESHRWKKDSYGKKVLNSLYADYQNFLNSHRYVSASEVEAYQKEFLGILARHAEKVHNDELRTYMNEMVIFGLEQAMNDHNPSVKAYTGK